MKQKFTVTGMTCSACSAGIERSLSKKDGVKKVEVFLMSESMNIEYDEGVISESEIISQVVSLGYGIEQFDEKKLRQKTDKTKGMKRRFFTSLIFLLPLLYFSMGGMFSLPTPPEKYNAIIQAVLSLVIIILNFKFFIVGSKALFKRVPNMDTLVSLGSGVSYGYSLYLTVMIWLGKSHGAHLFYESAAMILTLVTLGKWLEEKSSQKTGEEVEKLIKLMPDTVTVERGGKQTLLPFSSIAVGDVLVVKQGDYIPVDGVVLEGSAYVDRAAVTGESMPLEVSVGSVVTGADIVKNGYLKVKAEKVGKDTTLSQIVRLVKEAGASKAPIQKIADKIAGIFVPAVTMVAIITFTVWILLNGNVGLAANYGISVLVISCPCALGLATPVAVMAATGRGMSLGILFKNAETLQKCEKINCVLLDKTATLTVGRPKVTDFELIDGTRKTALDVAFAIESISNHPIAECVRDFAKELGASADVAVKNYVYTTGKGARAVVGETEYVIGNPKLLEQPLQKRAEELSKKYAKTGKTPVFLASKTQILAVFALADTLKETSKAAVKSLKDRKMRVAMLTGDNETVAKCVAQSAGIDDYFAEALPEDKTKAVQRVQSVGGVVAMVGDGINDSPALKAADVGIAMGTGTDVAIDSADIVLVSGNLESVADAFDLSKAAVKNIKQNLFWAFFYNVVAIPIAAGVFSWAGITLNPMIAAAAMSCSSLFVVGNALRLTRFKKTKTDKITLETAPTTVLESETVTKKEENQGENGMKKTIIIEGMMCGHCVRHVKTALEKLDGVVEVVVTLEDKSAVVTLEKDVENAILSTAITDEGYEVLEIR